MVPDFAVISAMPNSIFECVIMMMQKSSSSNRTPRLRWFKEDRFYYYSGEHDSNLVIVFEIIIHQHDNGTRSAGWLCVFDRMIDTFIDRFINCVSIGGDILAICSHHARRLHAYMHTEPRLVSGMFSYRAKSNDWWRVDVDKRSQECVRGEAQRQHR